MISRRGVLASGALACACHASAFRFAMAGAGARVLKRALHEFHHGAVSLAPGPMLMQFEQQQELFLSISDDMLLKPFRARAGLPAPGDDMGGWYDNSADFHIDPDDWSSANWHGFIPGHSFGQYVSGLARGFAITGDTDTQQKVARLVRKFALAISPRFFADYNLPAYTYDKLVVGLVDAYHLAGVTEAKEALRKVTDAVLPFLPEKALTREERRARPYTREAQIWDEPYTLPENLYLASQRGMGDQYQALAARYLQDAALFDPLARGVSPLAGKHAYSHVNALSSAVQAFLATGNDKYLAAARNGFAFVQAQSYATGGWGPDEELLAAGDHETLFAMLGNTHRSFETPCGAYAHFKITRSLLRITKDSRYGDSMERVLYNTILGAKPTLEDGSTFYYSDYHEHATKFYRKGEPWPCCSGTFIQLTADYGISTYLFDDQSIYVNLYVPSQLRTKIDGVDVRLVQTTTYPLANVSRLRFDALSPARFAIHLRIPAWAGPGTRIVVNGTQNLGTLKPGTFAEIRRKWHPKDFVEIRFDMGTRLEPLNEAHPEMVALMTGPLVLFPIDAPEAPLTRAEWLSARREGEDEWAVVTRGTRVRLKPFMAINDETYRLYSRVRES
ncbi:MAG TPA: beta-L-arabinofuranosidase domain-containing protein [Steroidobacteraceae bacterium]|nr:beta-L-arabinofuranosidase domain-containing protein [Steroidobacteraceae bacterium]